MVPEFEAERWLDADLDEPGSSVHVVGDIASWNKPLSHIIHCAFNHTKAEVETLNVYDFFTQIAVNVLEPMILTKNLLDFGALEWSGSSIFLRDHREFPQKLMPTGLSKDMLEVAAKRFEQFWPVSFSYSFVSPPDRSRMGSGEQLVKEIKQKLELV